MPSVLVGGRPRGAALGILAVTFASGTGAPDGSVTFP